MIRHIALETKKTDIQEFYVGILGGEVMRQFTLHDNGQNKLLDIPRDIEVYELELQDLRFDLFIDDTPEMESHQHMCFELENAGEVFEKANMKKYKTCLRKKNQVATYFIKDNSGNLFEISNKSDYNESFIS
jgi:hypothetical protein